MSYPHSTVIGNNNVASSEVPCINSNAAGSVNKWWWEDCSAGEYESFPDRSNTDVSHNVSKWWWEDSNTAETGAFPVDRCAAGSHDAEPHVLPESDRGRALLRNRNAAGRRRPDGYLGNSNAAGLHNAGAGAPLANSNAAGDGAPLGNSNAAGYGAPPGNSNAAGYGAPPGNLNAVGSHAGAPLGNTNATGIHRPATEKAAQRAYDTKIGELQKSANCAADPFNVPILESDQTKALKAIAAALKAATRIVTCCVCDNMVKESDCTLLVTTMDQPPPDSWLAPLRETVNSIIIEGAPDPKSLDRQYRVLVLQGMSPAWSNILLSPRGIYQVTSPEDTTVQDCFVYPFGSYADMHVNAEATHASMAKACVCNRCAKCLKNERLPQFACANDLCIGTLSPLHYVLLLLCFTQTWVIFTFNVSYVSKHHACYNVVQRVD